MGYIKETFDVVTYEQAKHVVLTFEPDKPEKFKTETDAFIRIIASQNIITENSTVLDFGCGMGRVSKELVNRFKCNVIGVDISDSMLMFATLHVGNAQKFKHYNSYTTPNSIDVCISSFVLQHVENPDYEIDNIYNVLKPNGYFVLLNELNRFVPTSLDDQNFVVWEDDKFDVFEKTESKFKKIVSIDYLHKKDHEVIFYQKI